MKVLITGGAGFIGSYTALALLARGHQVAVLDNFSPQIHGADSARSFTWNLIKERVDLIEGDVRDKDLLYRQVPGFEAVLHLAAETGTGQSMYDVSRYCEVNVGGTANLLESLVRDKGQVRRVVVASSRAVYGEGTYLCETHGRVFPQSRRVTDMQAGRFEPLCPVCDATVRMTPTVEEAILRPASVYAVTKLSQEQLVLAVGASLGISASALRYQNVYGPGQSLHNPYTGILSIFSSEMRAGRDIEIFEDGQESRDFVHVQDVADVNVAFLESEAATGLPVNVGTGRAVAVLDVANRLRDAYRSNSRIRISGRFRAGDIRHNCAAVDRLQTGVGFVPRIPFESGIEGFCAWASGEMAAGQVQGNGYATALRELESRGLMKPPKTQA